MSPLKTLARGYSVVEEDGKLVKSVKDVKKDDIVNIRLSDGKVDAKIVQSKLEGEIYNER